MREHGISVWAALLLLLVGCSPQVAERHQPATEALIRPHRIAFIAEGPKARGELRIVDEMSKKVRTVSDSVEWFSWSPDGRTIAFTKDMLGGQGLWVVDVDGGTLEKLVSGDVREGAWSPDGERLCYSAPSERPESRSSIPTGPSGIWVIEMASRKTKKLGESAGIRPRMKWSPGGEAVADTSVDLFKGSSLTLVSPDTGESKVVFKKKGLISEFRWSPDGKMLAVAYRPSVSRSTLGLHIIDRDGTNVGIPSEQLPNVAGQEPTLEWSPDSKAIAFDELTAPDKAQVVVAWIKNEAAPRIERIAIAEGARPRWSPDGSKIAFNQRDLGIYVCNPDGSAKQKVAEGGMFTWSPDSKRIAFVAPSDLGRLLAAFLSPDAVEPASAAGLVAMDVYSVNADGTGLKRLTTDGGFKLFMSYAPR